ncbi:MAG: hypothetical protein ACYDCL_01055 [Myxococcales bacterium]
MRLSGRAVSWLACLSATFACDPVHMIGKVGDTPDAAVGLCPVDSGSPPPGDGGDGASSSCTGLPCPCGQICGSTGDRPTPACRSFPSCSSSPDCPQAGGWSCLSSSGGCGASCLEADGGSSAACATDLDCPCGSACAVSGTGSSCHPEGPSCASDADCSDLGVSCVTLYRGGQACGAACIPLD